MFRTRGRAGVLLKREQVWCRESVDRLSTMIREDGEAFEHEHSTLAAARRALELSERLTGDRTLEGQLRRLLYAIDGLERHARAGGLDAEETDRIYRRARSILARHRVDRTRSRISFLHGILGDATAAVLARAGDRWRASVQRGSRSSTSEGDPVLGELLRASELAMLAGHASAAVELLLEAELRPEPSESTDRIRVARARILRLSGDGAGAEALLERVEISRDAALAIEVAWERACLESVADKDVAPIAQLIRTATEQRTPRHLAVARLWSHAIPSNAWRSLAPKGSSLARSHRRDEIDPETLRFIVWLDRAYGSHGSSDARRAAIARALEGVDSIRSVEEQMLALAAAGRWSFRAKQGSLAALAIARYRAIGSGLAVHRGDPFGVASDLFALGADPKDEEDLAEAPSTIPASGIARAARSSALLVELARIHARSLASRWDGEADEAAERIVEYARALSRYSVDVRGLAMKLGQIASFYGFDLPEDAIDAFRPLQDSAPQLDADRMMRVIEEDFGAPLSDLFAEIEEQPFATGSIGQVYAAVLKDGTRAAVKVQYPDIEKCIRADLRALGIVRPFLQLLLPGWDLIGLSRELANQLLGECDFRREAAAQAHFRARLTDEEHIHVPAVIATHSARRVITSELVSGVRLYAFRDSAPQEEKNRATALVTRFVIRTLVVERHFNTDFHPGNFLFSERGLHVVDFGNVRRWTGEEGRGFRRLIEAIASGDAELFRRAFIELGLFPSSDGVDFERAFRLLLERGELLKRMGEDRASRIERGAIRRDIALWSADHPEARRAILPPAYAFAMRAYFGSFAILAELGGELNWRRLVLGILAEHPS